MNSMQPKLFCTHTFNALPTLPATRRGQRCRRRRLDAAHAFGRSFAGQFTAAGDVHAKERKPSLRQLRHFERGRQKWRHFETAATGNELTGADEQEAGRYEADRVNGIAAEAADMSRLVGSAGRVDGLGGPGRRA